MRGCLKEKMFSGSLGLEMSMLGLIILVEEYQKDFICVSEAPGLLFLHYNFSSSCGGLCAADPPAQTGATTLLPKSLLKSRMSSKTTRLDVDSEHLFTI